MAAKTNEVLLDPLFNNNPIALQVLGICSALAVTTQLKTARTIAGVSFNGTQNITIASHNLSDMTNDTTYTHSGKIITDAERTAISTNTTTITNNKNSLDTDISNLQQRATTLENDVVIKGDPAGATEQLISGIKKFTKKI